MRRAIELPDLHPSRRSAAPVPLSKQVVGVKEWRRDARQRCCLVSRLCAVCEMQFSRLTARSERRAPLLYVVYTQRPLARRSSKVNDRGSLTTNNAEVNKRCIPSRNACIRTSREHGPVSPLSVASGVARSFTRCWLTRRTADGASSGRVERSSACGSISTSIFSFRGITAVRN